MAPLARVVTFPKFMFCASMPYLYHTVPAFVGTATAYEVVFVVPIEPNGPVLADALYHVHLVGEIKTQPPLPDIAAFKV